MPATRPLISAGGEGMAGRPPKPIEQHLKEGTYRKDRHSGALVVTTPGTGIAHLGPPAHLTTLQREIWIELARMLDTIVRESDAPMVELAAVAYSSYRVLEDDVRSSGYTFVDDKGNVKANPSVQMRDRSMKMFMDLSARLGLSPADRARLGLNISALAKTAGQLMEERYGDTEDDAGEVIEVHDASMEADTLSDLELGYDA
jgi:P27 family predicted phage terminase small subunit